MFTLTNALGCPLYGKPVLGRMGEAFTLVGIEAEPQCVSTSVALSLVVPSSLCLVLKSVTCWCWVVISWIGSVSFRFMCSGYSEEIRRDVSLRISTCLFSDYTISTKKTSTSAKTRQSSVSVSLPSGRPRRLMSLCLYPTTSKMQLNENTERPSLCLCPILISKGSEGSARNFTCGSSGNVSEFGEILLRFFPLYSMYRYLLQIYFVSWYGRSKFWMDTAWPSWLAQSSQNQWSSTPVHR